MSMLALSMWWKNKDEEWWIKMDAKRKFMNLFIPTEINGSKELVQLPLQHDTGQIFGGLIVAFADAAYRQDPDAMNEYQQLFEWAGAFVDSHSPVDLPLQEGATGLELAASGAFGVLPKVYGELATNRKSYWHTPVISPQFMGPGGQHRVPREEEHTVYTTEAAKYLGRLANLSPQALDHAVQSVGGPGLRDALVTAEMPFEAMFTPKEERPWSEVPVVGTLFKRGGPLGTRPRPIDALYDHHELALQRQFSVENPETEVEAERRKMLTDATGAMSLLFHIRSFHKKEKNRRLITKKAVDIADRAVRQLRYEDYERNSFRLDKARLEIELAWEKITKFEREGKFEQAKAIREKLRASQDEAQQTLRGRIPRTIGLSPKDAIEKQKEWVYQRRRAGLYDPLQAP